MKLRFFAFIVGILIICPFASPVSGTLMLYDDNMDALVTDVNNDPDYILHEPDNVRDLFFADPSPYEDDYCITPEFYPEVWK